MNNGLLFGILIVAIAAVGTASLTTILGEVIQIVSAEEQGDDQGKIFLAKNKERVNTVINDNQVQKEIQVHNNLLGI